MASKLVIPSEDAERALQVVITLKNNCFDRSANSDEFFACLKRIEKQFGDLEMRLKLQTQFARRLALECFKEQAEEREYATCERQA